MKVNFTLEAAMYKYFLKASFSDNEKEVTQDEFVRAEQNAGFHPKYGCGPVATGGFSNGTISGRVEYVVTDKENTMRTKINKE